MYLNINRLQNKFDELQTKLHELKIIPHVIIVLETWLTSELESKVYIENYKVEFCHRKEGKKGGGIAIFIHNTIDYESPKRQHIGFNHYMLIKLLDKFNMNLLAFYRTPDKIAKPAVFWNELEQLLPTLGDTIICCDSNMNVLEKQKKYKKLFTANGFRICNKIANKFDCYTFQRERLGKWTYSIIDQIMPNMSKRVNVDNFVVKFSDHRLLYVTVEL